MLTYNSKHIVQNCLFQIDFEIDMDIILKWILPLYPLLVTSILLYVIQLLWSAMNFRAKDPNCKAPLPPGSMGLPIFGETINFLIKGSEFYEEKFRKYGRLTTTHLFGDRTIRVRGADNLRKILYSEDDYVQLKYPTSTLRLFGENTIITASGSHHIQLRKCMASVFKQQAMEGYVDMIRKPFIDAISSWCDKDSILAYDCLRKVLFQITGKILCGFDSIGEEAEKLNIHFDNLMKGLLSLPINLPGTTFRKALDSKKVIFDAIERKLIEKEKIPAEEDVEDALRRLMEEPLADGSTPSHADIRDNAFDLLFASFSATSSACTMLLLKLIQHPEVVEKIRQELDDHGILDPKSPLSLHKINSCQYILRVVLESLRMSAPIPASYRTVLKTFELDGMQIPKGWKLLWSIRDTMIFSDSFTNREKFDPDRFSKERNEHRIGGRYNFPVFGGGARACPGQQLAKLILRIEAIEIIRNCNFEMLRPETLKIRSMPCPFPTNGLPTKFTRLSCEDIQKTNSIISKDNENETLQTQVPVCFKG